MTYATRRATRYDVLTVFGVLFAAWVALSVLERLWAGLGR